MSDNTPLDPGAGPEQARSLERTANIKTQVVALDMGGADGPEKLLGDANPMPVQGEFYPATQPVSLAAVPLPAGASTEATLAALKAAIDALSAKITACNTGAVTLDAGTLAALETITVANPTAQGLTDTELRASALAVTVSNPTEQGLTDTELRAAPLTVVSTGAATETTLLEIAEAVRATDSPYTNGDLGIFMLGKRRDDDSTMVADGDYSGINLDEAGRVKVATQPGSIPAKVQAITANAQTVFMDVARASNITISMVAASLVGHNVTFEYSNNSTNGADGNWYGVQVVRSNANTVDTTSGVLAATPVYGWEASVNAYRWFRVRATAHTSGTATYTLLPGSYATEPIPAVQVTGTQPVSGSVTATLASPTTSIINSAATTNGTVVKSASSLFFGMIASNSGATVAYVKVHNTATVTVGTSAVALWLRVPPGETAQMNVGPLGARFLTGICLSITGGIADTDTTAVAAGQVKVITSYL